MMKKGSLMKKRSVILGLLVVVLGLAVYLNWYMSKEGGSSSVTDVLTGSTLGQAMYVNGDASSVAEDDYFATARTERETARKQAVSELKEIIDNVKSDSSAVAEATKESTAIAKSIETESNIETLVKAKGFEDCVAVIAEDSVSVVVKTNGLSAAQTVQIQEIVEGQSGISLENIKIIEVK